MNIILLKHRTWLLAQMAYKGIGEQHTDMIQTQQKQKKAADDNTTQ